MPVVHSNEEQSNKCFKFEWTW